VEERYRQARILIVDDQEMNTALLTAMLDSGGYVNVVSILDPRLVLRYYEEFDPDLILLDLNMPHLDGLQVLEQLTPRIAQRFVPIVVLTGNQTPEAKQQALSMGAKDFLCKPFGRTEVLLRIRNLLETRLLYLQLQQHNEALEEAVRQRTLELEETQREILERLALAAEYRDDTTGHHAQRVASMSLQIALRMGLAEHEAALIGQAALLHDVGKIGIPDHILLKRDAFTPEEREVMGRHTVIGARLVAGSRSPLLRLAEEVALTHHSRWDGQDGHGGGPAISLAGRIVAVADVFDALTHERPYKAAWPAAEAAVEIQRQSGRQFDPHVVSAFLAVLREREQLVPTAMAAA
jgi:putative two-component system response regulator